VEIGGSLALFERIFAYLDLVPEIVDAPDAAQLQRASVRGGVELRNVSFRYPQPPGADTSARRDTFALQEITFSAEPGSLTALVGPSGSGKSTILSLIPRFWDTKSGSVLIDGRDVRQIKLSSLGEMIGVVTQETHLLHASIGDNLRYARPNATDEQLGRHFRVRHSMPAFTSYHRDSRRSLASAATSSLVASDSAWPLRACS
jgi:ATP-binding cassette subfamily B protein